MSIIKPIGTSIFVLPDKANDTSAGGIILTDYSRKRPTTGTIIGIGDKVTEFKVGMRIVYGEFSGIKEKMEYPYKSDKMEEIFIMQPEDIVALLE